MVTSVRRAYLGLDEPPRRFILRTAVPAFAGTVVLVLALAALAPAMFMGAGGVILVALPFLVALAVLSIPVVLADQRRVQIDHAIGLYVTHMTVLASANVARADILRTLGETKEYGALAGETRRIAALVDDWHLSLSDACRTVGERTPSRILSDFLDRFAYSLDSGEDLEGFLKTERAVVMKDFTSSYRGGIRELETLKDLYNSMMMSVVFLVVFATLVPVLIGLDPLMVLIACGAITAFVEVMFVALARLRAPNDPLWHAAGITTRVRRNLHLSLALGAAGVVVAGAIVLAIGTRVHVPTGIAIAAAATPLLMAGIHARREDDRVIRRDRNFPAFIRSLGASVTSRGGTVPQALHHLRHTDFGPLTTNIHDMYTRLVHRVDGPRAWRYFAAESGSRMVSRYSDVFIAGIRAGGRGDIIGRIVSDDAVTILNLRKERDATVQGLSGLLGGLVAGTAFSLFVGVGILAMLQRMLGTLSNASGVTDLLGDMFSVQVEIAMLETAVAIILLVHCAASAIILHAARSGHPQRSLVDFVTYLWIAGVAGSLSSAGMAFL